VGCCPAMTPSGAHPAKVFSGGVAELKYHWVSGVVVGRRCRLARECWLAGLVTLPP
jgi:membrane-associated PAP2 superfamily phosphatase